jgi:hypothetical protein
MTPQELLSTQQAEAKRRALIIISGFRNARGLLEAPLLADYKDLEWNRWSDSSSLLLNWLTAAGLELNALISTVQNTTNLQLPPEIKLP